MSTYSLMWFAPGAMALVTHSIAGRAMVARQKKETLYAYAAGLGIGAVIFTLLLLTLSRQFQYLGIPMGTCIYQLVILNLISYFLLYRYAGAFAIPSLIKHLVSAIVLSAAALLVPLILAAPGSLPSVFEIPLSFTLLLLAIAGIHWILKTDSYRFLKERL